jgi:hypothetical protein
MNKVCGVLLVRKSVGVKLSGYPDRDKHRGRWRLDGIVKSALLCSLQRLQTRFEVEWNAAAD